MTSRNIGPIAIRLPNGTMLNAGDANPRIGCDITTPEGSSVLDSSESDIPSDNTDAFKVAAWQCPECFSLVVKLEQPADGCWTTAGIKGAEHGWNQYNHMQCATCEHEGNAEDFEVSVNC